MCSSRQLLTISNDFYKLESSGPYAVIEKRIIQKLWFLKIQWDGLASLELQNQ